MTIDDLRSGDRRFTIWRSTIYDLAIDDLRFDDRRFTIWRSTIIRS